MHLHLIIFPSFSHFKETQRTMFLFNILAILLLLITIVDASKNTCPLVRYSGFFNSHDHVKDHALVGKSYKNLSLESIQQCFSVCVQDCRCVSYQMIATRCELVDENKHTAPEHFKPLPGYKYFELKQQFKQVNLHI